MSDKDFLDRIKYLVDAYLSIHSSESETKQMTDFVKWTYSMYGIVLPEDRVL